MKNTFLTGILLLAFIFPAFSNKDKTVIKWEGVKIKANLKLENIMQM